MKLFNSTILTLTLLATFYACGGNGDDSGDGGNIETNSSSTNFDQSDSYMGSLDSSDPILDNDDTYYDTIALNNIPAGVTIDITVESSDFNAYVFLIDENGDGIDYNSENTLFSTNITETGNYIIYITSYGGLATGNYTVSWHIYSTDNAEDNSTEDDDDTSYDSDYDECSSDSDCYECYTCDRGNCNYNPYRFPGTCLDLY